MAEQVPLLPFRYGTRQRFRKVGVIPFTAFGDSFQLPKEFPHVGFLSEIVVQFRGTATLSGAGAFADRGPWDLVKRFRVNLNVSSLSLADLSGYGAFLVSATREQGARSDKAGSGDTVPDPDIYLAGVGATGSFVLTWVIPVAANDNENFGFGLINLQAPQLQCNLEGVWGSAADVLTTLTGLTGNLHIGYTYYEVPNPNEVQLPPPLLHRMLEDSQPISSTGEQIYTVPRQGNLLQMWHQVRLNGTRNNASVNNLKIVLNNTDEIYNFERQMFKLHQRFNFDQEWPAGNFLWDFWAAQTGVSNGDTRDAINTEAISLLESRIEIDSTATLGVGNNNLVTIRRFLQQLAA